MNGISLSDSYEVEIKVPIEDPHSIEQIIREVGGTRLNSETQTDMYYDHPSRSFSDTDESVRVRERSASDIHAGISAKKQLVELTYKGPKVDNTTKTRLEYTVTVNDLDSLIAILHHTGFKHVAAIIKHRTFFIIDDITVSVDDVEDVGFFMELEIMAKGDDTLNEARTKLFSLLRKLQQDPTNTIRQSYLELYLERKSK